MGRSNLQDTVGIKIVEIQPYDLAANLIGEAGQYICLDLVGIARRRLDPLDQRVHLLNKVSQLVLGGGLRAYAVAVIDA